MKRINEGSAMKKILRILLPALFAGAVAAMAQQNQPAPSKQAATAVEAKTENNGPVSAVETPQKDSAAAHKSTSAPVATEVKSENGVVKVIVNVNDRRDCDDNDTNYFKIDFGKSQSSSESSGFFHRRKSGEKNLFLAGKSERNWKYVMMAGYGTGLSVSYGIQIEDHRITANYFGNDKINGGGLAYDYRVWSYGDNLNVFPGIIAGYWSESWESREKVYYSGPSYYWDYVDHDESYFFGPRVNIEAGFKVVFVSLSGTLLIGSSVKFPMAAGLTMLF
jgi:hypothetical protein